MANRKAQKKIANKTAQKKSKKAKGGKHKPGCKSHLTKKELKLKSWGRLQEGEAGQYITRSQALAKLNVPLPEFRRMCILKGIYPRDPKKKGHGSDKTYYHKKDIKFVAHDPVLRDLFKIKKMHKDIQKLVHKQNLECARRKCGLIPKLSFAHIVRERYPSFGEAVRDLDDALCMLALFNSISADAKRDIPVESVSQATRLYQEFQLYVISTKGLRKVFASIKGYYFQAEIMGQKVTWLAPHQFTQTMPDEVDFKIMVSFLDFYLAMLKFVNFKLYSDAGMVYPPKRNTVKDGASLEVGALELDMLEAGSNREATEQAEMNVDSEVSKTIETDFGKEALSDEARQEMAQTERLRNTFRGLNMFVNREVPLRPVYFVLLCGGVKQVGWERGSGASSENGSPFTADHGDITHQIIDRPMQHLTPRVGREMVQPQWVFDSFNTGCVLPVSMYAPDKVPPPHLSPFVDDVAEGYVPRQRELLDRLAKEAGSSSSVRQATEDPNAVVAPRVEVEDTPETRQKLFAEELRSEASGTTWAEFKQAKADEENNRVKEHLEALEKADNAAPEKLALVNPGLYDLEAEPADPKAKPTEEAEARANAIALMSGRRKRMLEIAERDGKKQSAKTEKLLKRRRMNERAKGQDKPSVN